MSDSNGYPEIKGKAGFTSEQRTEVHKIKWVYVIRWAAFSSPVEPESCFRPLPFDCLASKAKLQCSSLLSVIPVTVSQHGGHSLSNHSRQAMCLPRSFLLKWLEGILENSCLVVSRMSKQTRSQIKQPRAKPRCPRCNYSLSTQLRFLQGGERWWGVVWLE